MGHGHVRGIAVVARQRHHSVLASSRSVWSHAGALAPVLHLLLFRGRQPVGSRERAAVQVRRVSAEFLLALIAGSAWLSFSRVGAVLVDRATVGTLVGAQSFRILAELLIVAAHHAGIAPAQMSIEGYNYDIVTGVAAMLLYFVMRRRPSRLLGWAFNAVGLGTLANVVLIAVASMPTRFQVFTGSSNLWLTQAPWALLPGVGVVAALVLHLILTRKLLHEQFRKA
jgi:hypothetical protein